MLRSSPSIPFAFAALMVALAAPVACAADGPADPNTVAPAGALLFDVRQTFIELDEASQMRFLRWLPRTGRRNLYPLAVESLYSDRPGTLEAAINCLGHIKVPLLMDNLPVVRQRMHHSNARIRFIVARLMGDLKDDLAIEGLIKLLSDQPKVATAAREALIKIADYDAGSNPAKWSAWYEEWLKAESDIIPNLSDKLLSEDEDEVLRAMHMLVLLKSHRHSVSDAILQIEDHPSPKVQAMVLTGLQNMGGVAALKSPEAANRSIVEVLQSVDSMDSDDASLTAPAGETDEHTGSGSSQVITILVLLGIFAGGGLLLARWVKQNPERVRRLTQTIRRKKKPTAEGSEDATGDGEGKKPRITFTR